MEGLVYLVLSCKPFDLATDSTVRDVQLLRSGIEALCSCCRLEDAKHMPGRKITGHLLSVVSAISLFYR
jgi:hypothetical protein